MTLRPMFLVATLACVAVPLATAQPVALEDRYFDSDGIRIRYVDVGQGEPILLFHAMSESVDTLRRNGLIDRLAGDFRVIAFDMRGHGKSDKPHEATAYGLAMVDDAARLLDHVQVRSAHIFGYSLGGYVAGRFVASYPTRARTATFGGSSVMSASLWAARFADRVGPIADALERGDPRPLLGRQAEGDELERRANELLSRNDPIALAAAVRSVKAVQLTNEEIAALKMPLLVIVGSRDLPESRIEAFEGLQPDLNTVVIDGATHADTVPRAEFSDSLRSFLLEHSSSALP
jgi:pimeloyl-ACP methyl ester carboxylesterase